MHPATPPSPDHNFSDPSVLPAQRALFCRAATPAQPAPGCFCEGIIDTVTLRIQVPLTRPDRQRLLSPGWTTTESKRRGSDGAEFGTMSAYLRESDGVKVIAKSMYTLVEASLPRVHGLGNHEQHLMTWSDTLRAISAITEKLLPWTTALARVRCEDRELDWALTRIDLARNFPGPVCEVVAALGDTRWKRSRRSASRIVRKGNVSQLMWAGRDRQLSLYDKGAEMRGEKKRTRFRNPPAKDTVGRAELRYIGTAGMGRLVVDAAASGASTQEMLPVLLKGSRGELVRRLMPIDATVLHAVLHGELDSLGATRAVPESCRTLAEFGLLLLARDPGAWEVYQRRNAGRRSVSGNRVKVAALRAKLCPCDLVERCYPNWNAAQQGLVDDIVSMRARFV